MGSKTRLSSYCSKRGDNTVNLVTSRKTNARLARPIPVPRYCLDHDLDLHGTFIDQITKSVTIVVVVQSLFDGLVITIHPISGLKLAG